MTVRYWNVLIRKLKFARERAAGAACLMIEAVLRRVAAEGGPGHA